MNKHSEGRAPCDGQLLLKISVAVEGPAALCIKGCPHLGQCTGPDYGCQLELVEAGL